jgi:hypothetical protein
MKVAFFRWHTNAPIIASIAFCILASVLIFELSACQAIPASSVAASGKTLQPRASEQVVKQLRPTSVVSHFRPTFERGIVFPRWGRDGFGPNDSKWTAGLTVIYKQTGAEWLELPIQLSQDNGQSVTVRNNEAPLPQYVRQAVSIAHGRGYKVFMIPLHLVHIPDGWAASVQFGTRSEEAAWFDSLFNAYRPYLQLAQDEGVEQVSIGTELVWMQMNAPSDLWNHYIDEVRSIYHGSLTYDSNWSEISEAIPDWMHNPHLNVIGVSEYISLTDTQSHLDPTQIRTLWMEKVQQQLDSFSEHLGKHLILSEIGYRNSWDTFWHSWDFQQHPPKDPAAQAAGVETALSLCLADTHIDGTFFWGWQDTGAFDLAGSPAARALHSLYTK